MLATMAQQRLSHRDVAQHGINDTTAAKQPSNHRKERSDGTEPWAWPHRHPFGGEPGEFAVQTAAGKILIL